MEQVQPSKNQLIRIGVIVLALLVLLFVPFERFSESKSICIHYNLLGIQCPLCGMTRAVHQFLHFRIASALHYNAAVVLLPLYLLVDVVTLFFQRRWLVVARKGVVVSLVVALFLLYLFRIAFYLNWI